MLRETDSMWVEVAFSTRLPVDSEVFSTYAHFTLGGIDIELQFLPTESTVVVDGAYGDVRPVARPRHGYITYAHAYFKESGPSTDRCYLAFTAPDTLGEAQAAVRQIALVVEDWRARFEAWAEAVTNPRPTAYHGRAQAKTIGEFQTKRGLKWIFPDPVEITLGPVFVKHEPRPLTAQTLEFVLQQTLDEIEPPAEYRLLRSAWRYLDDQDFRLAMIELATAAELALHTLCRIHGIEESLLERATFGRALGVYADHGGPFPSGMTHESIQTGLVNRRNDAAHRSEADEAGTLEAFGIAEQLVALAYPLPGGGVVGPDVNSVRFAPPLDEDGHGWAHLLYEAAGGDDTVAGDDM